MNLTPPHKNKALIKIKDCKDIFIIKSRRIDPKLTYVYRCISPLKGTHTIYYFQHDNVIPLVTK